MGVTESAQKYLFRFGYLQQEGAAKEGTNFQDALRRFQRRHRLRESGGLDEETRNKMGVPRCGRRDLLPLEGGPRSAAALTSGRFSCRWPGKDLRVRIGVLPRNRPNGFDDDGVVQEIKDAFSEWAHSGLSFRFVAAEQEADIEVSWVSGASSLTGPVAADAEYPEGCSSIDRKGLPRRISMDDDEPWAVIPDVNTRGVKVVLVHEIGHVLGFVGHSDDPTSVMFEELDRLRSSLSPVDLQLLAAAYQ